MYTFKETAPKILAFNWDQIHIPYYIYSINLKSEYQLVILEYDFAMKVRGSFEWKHAWVYKTWIFVVVVLWSFFWLLQKYHIVREYFWMQHKTKNIFFCIWCGCWCWCCCFCCRLCRCYYFTYFQLFCFHALTYIAVLCAILFFIFIRETFLSLFLLFVWIFRIVSQQRRWIYIKYSTVFQFRLLSAAKLLHLLKGTVLYILLFVVSLLPSLHFSIYPSL